MALEFKFVLGFCLLSLGLCASDVLNKDIVIKNVERKIDLTTQLVKISHKITIENTGSSPVKYFLMTLTQEEFEKVSFLGAQVGSYQLAVGETTIPNHPGYHFYRVDLRDVLQGGKTSSPVEVEVVLAGALRSYPASIQQGEKQLVVYENSHWVPASYKVTSQTTTVLLPSPNPEGYSKLKPTMLTDTTIMYGPYDNVPAFSSDPMKIHYETSSSFLTITNLERVLEVSHWGNIAVEETIDLLHTGAKLKGSFSRYDYQRDHNTHTNVKSFRTILPASARDVYYRDEIGNISTSNLRVKDDSVEVDLRPRFPLFGGWKTHYKLGYNVPSYEYLFNSGDQYALKMRLLDHVYDDMVVEQMRLKIILPEGVRDVQISTPFPVIREDDSLLATYLDTVGRVVISLKAAKLNTVHIQDFTIFYKFPGLLMLQEPLLVVAAFLALFIAVMIWVRLDLTLSPDRDAEAKMRVSSHCSLVTEHHFKRVTIYHSMLEEITKQQGLGNPPNALNQFQGNIKKLQASLRDESQAVAELLSKIRADNSEIAEKVSELQKYDKEVREAVVQQCTNMEKLLGKKMPKQAYADQEQILSKRREEAMDKLRNVAALL
ncbi:Ribophorin I [Trinorchestia longiramus]|nr:Ribophorin I [Trinorchestia longiramus]